MSDTAPDLSWINNIDWSFLPQQQAAAQNPDLGFLNVIARMTERYPSYTWLFQNAEVGRLLWEATEQEWSPEVFQSKVQSTDWWKSTSAAQRDWERMNATDPATVQTARGNRRAQLEDLSAQLGAPLDPALLDDLTERSLSQGWSAEAMQDAVAANVQVTTGQGAATVSNMRAMASRYMVEVDDATYLNWTRDLAAGRTTQEAVEERLRQLAKARFPQLVEQIDQGIAPADFAAGYKKISERLTGKPAETIDVTSALGFVDPSNGKLRPMSYDEWTRQVRGSRDFADGRTGRAEAASFGMAFQRLLGTRA